MRVVSSVGRCVDQVPWNVFSGEGVDPGGEHQQGCATHQRMYVPLHSHIHKVSAAAVGASVADHSNPTSSCWWGGGGSVFSDAPQQMPAQVIGGCDQRDSDSTDQRGQRSSPDML